MSAKSHVWTAPCWQGVFDLTLGWSELPCVRPFGAALDMAAGHNALRGPGPDQKLALEAPGTKWVVPVHGPTGLVHYRSIALSNIVRGGWSAGFEIYPGNAAR